MTVYSQIAANKAKTYVVMAVFILIFSGFFYLIGKYYQSPAPFFLLGLSIALISSFASYFYSDKAVLKINGAIPADKKKYFNFYTVAENLSIASGLPMPKLFVINDPAPNAFATGRDPQHAVVCATTGLLDMMDRAELEGVIAHELSHVKNYDILLSTVVAVLVGTLALITHWIWWGGLGRRRNDDEGRSPIFFILFILTIVLTPIIATIIQLAISRKREYLADASGALLTRYPDGLARALEKIENNQDELSTANSSTAHLFIANPFKKDEGKRDWFTSLFSTHPPIEERIKILRSM